MISIQLTPKQSEAIRGVWDIADDENTANLWRVIRQGKTNFLQCDNSEGAAEALWSIEAEIERCDDLVTAPLGRSLQTVVNKILQPSAV